MSVAVQQCRGLVGHHLLQDRRDRLALGEPLAPYPGEHPICVGLVETDRPGRPAIGKGQSIEVVQYSWMRHGRKTHYRDRPEMSAAEPGLEPTNEWFIHKYGIEVHRDVGT